MSHVRNSADLTLWIVASDAYSTSYTVYRGPRTRVALSARLGREERHGRTARLQLEIDGCAPADFTLDELVDLGVVEDGEPEERRTATRRFRAAVVSFADAVSALGLGGR